MSGFKKQGLISGMGPREPMTGTLAECLEALGYALSNWPLWELCCAPVMFFCMAVGAVGRKGLSLCASPAEKLLTGHETFPWASGWWCTVGSGWGVGASWRNCICLFHAPQPFRADKNGDTCFERRVLHSGSGRISWVVMWIPKGTENTSVKQQRRMQLVPAQDGCQLLAQSISGAVSYTNLIVFSERKGGK